MKKIILHIIEILLVISLIYFCFLAIISSDNSSITANVSILSTKINGFLILCLLIFNLIFLLIIIKLNIPKVFFITILGREKTGKSTLITSMLKLINKLDLILGSDSKNTFLENKYLLDKDIPIKQTNADNSYSFQVIRNFSNILKRNKVLEFADLPGEMLSELIDGKKKVNKLNFYEPWIKLSSVFLYLFDYGQYLKNGNDYLQQTIKDWNVIQSKIFPNNIEVKRLFNKINIIFLITKFDLVLLNDKSIIDNYGFNESNIYKLDKNCQHSIYNTNNYTIDLIKKEYQKIWSIINDSFSFVRNDKKDPLILYPTGCYTMINLDNGHEYINIENLFSSILQKLKF